MRALITGANGDIGFAILNYLLEQQAEVVALDKTVQRLQTISASSPKLTLLQADLSDLDNVQRTLNALPAVDILVYAAGVREITPMVDLALADWQKIMSINMIGAFIISQWAAKLAIENRSPLCIIYISSISGLYGEPERAAYCASKHGLIGLAKSQAIELASYGVRVNVIAPGMIETELTRPYQANAKVMEQINRNIPLGRWGRPEHIVHMVDLIIKNDYLTGSTLVVDGGWTVGKQL